MPTLNGILCELYSIPDDATEEAPEPDSSFSECGQDVDLVLGSASTFVEVTGGRFGIRFALNGYTAAGSGMQFTADIEINGFKVAAREDLDHGSYFTRNNLIRRVTEGTDMIDFSLRFTKIQMKHCRDLEPGEEIDDFGTIVVIVRKKDIGVDKGESIRTLDGEFNTRRTGGVPLEAFQRNSLSHTVQLCLPTDYTDDNVLQAPRSATYEKDRERSSQHEGYYVKFVFKYRSAEMIRQVVSRTEIKAEDSQVLSGSAIAATSTSSSSPPHPAKPAERLRYLEQQSKHLAQEIERAKRQKKRTENRHQRKVLQRQLRDRQPV